MLKAVAQMQLQSMLMQKVIILLQVASSHMRRDKILQPMAIILTQKVVILMQEAMPHILKA
jgi:hypothetical protein